MRLEIKFERRDIRKNIAVNFNASYNVLLRIIYDTENGRKLEMKTRKLRSIDLQQLVDCYKDLCSVITKT